MKDDCKVLDLFSGTEAFSRAFEEDNRFKVTTVDIQNIEWQGKEVTPDVKSDILELEAADLPDADIILSSPPCTKFSVASIGHHWETIDGYETYMPTKKECMIALELVHHTMNLVRTIKPEYWFMENPRAMLRKLLWMPKGTITWCQYWTDRDYKERGDPVMKPTDLWGNHPEGFKYKSCSNGSDCHTSAPRGSQSGTQAKADAVARGSIPYGLSKSIRDSIVEATHSR